jgi:hypothetical protein
MFSFMVSQNRYKSIECISFQLSTTCRCFARRNKARRVAHPGGGGVVSFGTASHIRGTSCASSVNAMKVDGAAGF